ncbi:WD repeat-containing protein 6-like isoform X3 [Photinus pyralis]|uniref:WD repeat-containing protein 6-like isoform X3 n=1 Tax=Photinus pyralis TaxID=7054 RepID=UPI0012670A03|nr:WD repeat-containing protein 6-like isoform X3 [Photinus pyralis]
MNSVKSLLLRTDVTCLKCCNSYIFAGTGDQIHIFQKTKSIKVIKIFEGVQIFGIAFTRSLTKCLVFGENKIAVLECDFLNINFEKESLFSVEDWILSAAWTDNDEHIVTVSMHNVVHLWSKEFELIEKKCCQENCILYSSHLVNNLWTDIIVLAGTVFSQILIWWPYKSGGGNVCPILAKLDGHKGVIFSIDCNQKTGIICSTSDDRSAILWSIPNKNLVAELLQPEPKIILKYSMYGHTARVFRCLALDERILTAGEDSLINVWDLEGNLIKRFEAHTGSPVWALDYDSENGVLATAGGDCGVTLLSLNDNIDKQEVEVVNKHTLKKVGALNNANLVGISERGMILLYLSSSKIWMEVKQHNDLISYALLDVWKKTNSIAFAGYYGTLHIYNQESSKLIHVCSYSTESKSRVFSLHWLSENNVLTCEAEGVVYIWLIQNHSIVLETHLKLPPSKERWTTCACLCGEKRVAVGDRKGNVYIYRFDNADPIQVIRKAHNYLGITNLHFRNDYLTSLGRNSLIKKYKFDQSKQQFIHLSSDKVPFSWTAAICYHKNCILLLAFLGKEFIVWDYQNRRTLLQFDCGGAHRSWDFCKLSGAMQFVFIKNKRHSTADKYALLSGGEDTTIRLSEIDWGIPPVKFKNKNIFKSHLSSVRAITACLVQSDSNYERYLISSAGGRAQLMLWEIEINRNDNSVNCSERCSHYEALSSDESETRIMDLCSVLTTKGLILLAATSNGTLRVFLADTDEENSYSMSPVGEVCYKAICILKVRHFKIQDLDIVLSACTGGHVTFWNFTDYILSRETSKIIQDDDQYKSIVEDISAVATIQLHSGGINSVDCKVVDCSRCLLLTGGDDNVIIFILLSLSVKNSKLNVEVLSKFCNSDLHCAQITGVFIASNYLITASVDQKVNTCKWILSENDVVCHYDFTYKTSIADIQGMQCFEKPFGVHAVIFGKGLELCEVLLK